MAKTLQAILAERKAIYDPQRALIAQQQAALAPEEAAVTAGLETAKTNAFSDITNQANARGMVYSGAPIAEQQRYVGERYLPAVANLKSDFLGRRTKLEGALLGINQDEMTSAQQLETEGQKAEAEAAHRAEQLALERQRVAISAKKTAAPRAKSPAAAKADAATELNQELNAAFADFKNKPKWYTENVVIPKLIAAYPEFDAQDITNRIYSYRKAAGYGDPYKPRYTGK
jgi:hypothetical protein